LAIPAGFLRPLYIRSPQVVVRTTKINNASKSLII
jgi:hypothetical protein